MIDVCLVTKNDIETVPGLEHVPVNNLIIEKSEPLAWARYHAIQKVTTEIFAFIDDDVELDPSWFATLRPHIEKAEVGAVQGRLNNVGLGPEWSEALKKPYRKPRSLELGDRGFTHNTLFKTELVRGWIPNKSVSAWEDFELTNHVLERGFQFLQVSTESSHKTSWEKSRKNIRWGVSGRKKIYPSKRDSVTQVIKKSVWIIRVLFSFKIGWREKIFRIHFNFWAIINHLNYLRSSRKNE
jgi:glycosyltransferase involved in cell wall biosynthesis